MNAITEEPGASFTLVNHSQSLKRLRGVMDRVGTAMSPEVFVITVSNVYHAVMAETYADQIHDMFRSSGSRQNFRQALCFAKERLSRPPVVLNLGCGAGYDFEVLREVFSRDEVAEVLCLDPSPEMLELAGRGAEGYPCRFLVGEIGEALDNAPYDLIITHSLVHHIPDLMSFFLAIDRLVASGGIYVMGHEPNRRFWNNRECRTVLEEYEKQQRRYKGFIKYLNPNRYLGRLKRALRLQEDEGWEARVNARLRQDHRLKGNLTCQEIWRLVDIHVPDPFDGDFSIGLNGFEHEELQAQYLPDWNLESFTSWGYLGLHNSAEVSGPWQSASASLAEKYPDDGSNFAAVWRKK